MPLVPVAAEVFAAAVVEGVVGAIEPMPAACNTFPIPEIAMPTVR